MSKKLKIPGLSFSWKRAFGITKAKRKVAKTFGVPTTRSGRRRKVARSMGCIVPLLAAAVIALLFALL